MRTFTLFSLAGLLGLVSCRPVNTAMAAEIKFDFGAGAVQSGYTQVLPDDSFSVDTGYGFVQSGHVSGVTDQGHALTQDAVTSEQPYYFSTVVPEEGNYKVTVTLGHATLPTETTIKAELRRLMIEAVKTEPGEFKTVSFVVNVRTPRITDSLSVVLKPRERATEVWAWDHELTLEFNGTQPTVCAMVIEPVTVTTVYILGDSTVCDQSGSPWNSWGQMLPRFFKPTVAVANHAESGESIRSSLGANRFEKVYSQLKPGDFVFMQFGHNDMKDQTPNASDIYQANLKTIVARIQALGGKPVLVTSMERKSGVVQETLKDYPDKVRQVAKELSLPLIDLNKMSLVLYRALGDDLDKAFQDGTHHNNYGSYLFAKCVAQGIKDNQLALAEHLSSDFEGFDPAQPDSPESFHMALSPRVTNIKPLGD